MIVIIAPRYDDVTARTHAVATEALRGILALHIAAIPLFENDATLSKISGALGDPIECVAYYGHGDDLGRLLTQEREPWCDACGHIMWGKTIYAHACRGMICLCRIGGTLGLECAMGYKIDLFQPHAADDDFWARFNEVHAFVVREIVQRSGHDEIKERFHEFCTGHLHALSDAGAGLIEMIAILQARDDFEILKFNASAADPSGASDSPRPRPN